MYLEKRGMGDSINPSNKRTDRRYNSGFANLIQMGEL